MINNKHEISGRRDSAVGRPSTRAYKTLFPQCANTNSESLVRPRTIENFHTTVDYRKFIKRLLKRLWLPLLIGGVQAAAVYVLLPKLMSEKPVFASKVSLLYKTPETKDQKNLSIGTIKEMIAMENNCQGVKTTLGLDESLESIKARTSVDTRGGTNLIELTVEGENIEKTVDLANTFAEVAYRNNRSFYENKAKAIMDKSEAQLVKARVNALVAQGAFVNFKEKKNVVDIAWTTRNMVDELSETESNATQTRSQVSAYESEQAYLVKLRGEQPAKVKRLTQTENFFKNQLLSAQISLMHLKNKYSMRNAKIVQMQKEIVSLKKSIAEVEEKSKGESMETNPQIAVIKNRIARNQISLEAARGRVGEMDALLKQRREDFQRFPLIQQEYATLQTKKEASEKIVDVYEENLRLARMDYVSPPTDFEI
ncbi:MAG: hypothetical protein HRT88_13445 [Lentisphaeraceae bacterium]|nr:hypothetical protein [Lentisphaeraceae bacterium]